MRSNSCTRHNGLLTTFLLVTIWILAAGVSSSIALQTDIAFPRARALSETFPFLDTEFLAVRTWDGGGVTGNWSEAANWSDDTIPNSGDTVVFDGTSTKDATIDISVSTSALTIASGYTGTISMAAGVDATFGNTSSQSAGTFNSGSGTLIFGSPAVGGGLNLSGGTLNAGSGQIIFRSVFNQTGGAFNGNSGDVSGTFNLTGGAFVAPSGNLTTGAAGGTFKATSFDHNNGTVVFIGGNGNFEVASLLELNNLTINKNVDGALNFFETNRTIRVTGTLSLIEGRLHGPQSTVVKAEGPVNIGVNFGDPDADAGGNGVILIKDGSGPRAIDWSSTASLPHIRLDDTNVTLTVSGTGTARSGSIHVLNGDFEGGSANLEIGYGASTIQGYLQSGGTFHIGTGNLSLAEGAFQLNGGTFTMDSGNATFFPCGTVNIAGGTFNASSGTTTMCPSGVLNGSFTQSNGIFNGGTGTIDVNHRFTLTGGTFNASSGNTQFGFVFDHQGGTFNNNNGTVVIDSTHSAYSINGPVSPVTEFHNLTFTSAGQVGLSSDSFITNGTLRLITGTVTGGTLRARGDVIVESTAGGGTAQLTFDAAGNQTFTNNGGANTTGAWTVNKPGGTLTAASGVILGTTQPLNVTSGTLYLASGGNLTAGALNIGANGRLANDSATTITLGANPINNGRLDLQGGGATCPDPDSILLRSSVDGVRRDWSGSGNYRLVDVDVKDMGGTNASSPAITVFSGTNSGNNNSNWTFNSGCPAELSISPETANITVGATQQFTGGGGFPPRTFTLVTNNSGASIDPATGLYTAGASANVVDTVRITDAFGSSADATVNVLGTASQVAFIVQPSSTTAGVSISPSVQVAIQDALGNTLPNATHSVTIVIAANPGSGVLTGTVTRNAIAGIATFDDLKIDRAGSGYTLQATSAGLTPATSNGFEIVPAAASQLFFVTQPSDVLINTPISPAVAVQIRDQFGNPVPSAVNSVTLIIGTNPGGGTMSGTLTRTPVAGTATFDDVSISAPGTGYTLHALSNGITTGQSDQFTVTDLVQVTNTNDSGAGSFRQAVINSNSAAGLQVITFNVLGGGSHTIFGSIPAITDPVVIDATTQPGYSGSPLIELRGNRDPACLDIRAGNSMVKGLVINNCSRGISISQNGGNVIQQNYIGTDITGSTPIFGCDYGIHIQSADGNQIGGESAGNVISGNSQIGIFTGSSGSNVIQGNYIGTNAAGNGGLGNYSGVYLQGSAGNVVGGDTPGTRNVISGNNGSGLTVWQSNGPASNETVIKGNFIGTDSTGTAAIPNASHGIFLSDTSDVIIGGAQVGERNLISGNTQAAIYLSPFRSPAVPMAGFTIKGNYIGTNAAGTVAIPNGSGILLNTNFIQDAIISDVAIGGAQPGEGNLISGNGIGISSQGKVATMTIMGNYIGTDAAGLLGIPNGRGIALAYGLEGPNSIPNNTIIGGTQAGESNIIGFNNGFGVVNSGSAGVSIRGNSIHSNVAPYGAISLTPSPNGNDDCDLDPGPNERQNYPDLASVLPSGGTTTIEGSLISEANTTYTIDFYSSTACSFYGYGEGKTYLGSTTITTGAACNIGTPFSTTLPVTAPGSQITATATDPEGNTSEFSPCLGPSARIEGTALDSTGQPLQGVQVEVKDIALATSRWTSTNASGRFSVPAVPLGRDYLVRLTKPSYAFTPPTRTYTNLSTHQDDVYTAGGALSIRGQVTKMALTSNAGGDRLPPAPSGPFPVSNVTMTLSGGGSQVSVTDSDGNYVFHNLLPGSYTITPSKINHTFTPPSLTFSIASNALVNFTAESAGSAGLSGRLVFDSNGDIRSMNADGSGVVTLVPRTRNRVGPNYVNSSPSISPDGARLVYTRTNTTTAISEIWTAAADGSGRTMVRGNGQGMAGSTYSPDATKIAFHDSAGVRVMNADGTNLLSIEPSCKDPDWSPDGLRLVYLCGGQVFTENATGGNRTAFGIGGTGTSALSAQWSPNSAKLAIVRRLSTGERQILLRNIDGTGLTVIASSPDGSYERLTWSPDGLWLGIQETVPSTLRRSLLPLIPIRRLITLSTDGTTMLTIADPLGAGRVDWSQTNTHATPPGTNINVQTGSVSITMPSVTGEGTTTVTPIAASSAGSIEGGFVVAGQAYNISTTANFDPSPTVCFTVPGGTYTTLISFNLLRLMHNEGGTLVDRTTSRNFTLRTVCGQVTSFSPFALGQQVDAGLPEISGLVVDEGGNPLSDVPVALSGDEERFGKTDQDGSFSFVNLIPGGDYVVEPAGSGYLYFLPYEVFPNISGSKSTVFVASQAGFEIKGTVRSPDFQPLQGVMVGLGGTSEAEAFTDANGEYSFSGLPPDGFYTVRAIGDGLPFNPAVLTLGLLSSDVSGADFVQSVGPTAASVSVSGRVTTADGRGIGGALLTIVGGDLQVPRRSITNPFGYYRLDDLPIGHTYLLTVQSKQYAFAQPTRVIAVVDEVADADFVAEP